MSLAHQFSVVNPKIRFDAIRWGMFKELADSLGVTGVPALIINGNQLITDDPDEAQLLELVQTLAGTR